jgi:hypothetical protein
MNKRSMNKRSILLLAVTVAVLCCAGCHRPPADDGREAVNIPNAAPAPPSPTPTPEDADLSLATAVVRILSSAHRTGSVIERAQCGARGAMVPTHLFPPTIKLEPLDQALQEITQRYPEIKWNEAAGGHVNVKDTSIRGSLLQVRIKEFFVVEDRPPRAALDALWQSEEVMAYLKQHHVRTSRHSELVGVARKSTPQVLHMKNASVREILDRIVDSYMGENGNSLHNVWIYRECRVGGETFAEMRVL